MAHPRERHTLAGFKDTGTFVTEVEPGQTETLTFCAWVPASAVTPSYVLATGPDPTERAYWTVEAAD